jgi:2-polyprenyl-3-methyl-5-hydroxy-6-metoxy-1,4-benzoquinol methylase
MQASHYVLGHSASELKRLDFQSKLLNPITGRLLRTAGIAPGMRVLDIGCGTGGVSLLAAKMVAPRGSVVGIDQNKRVIEVASAHAKESGLPNLSFHTCALDAFESKERFDLIVGRYVLIHQTDPADFLKHLARLARPGIRIAFHEFDLVRPPLSHPAIELWDLTAKELLARGIRAQLQAKLAQQIADMFVSADLPRPDVFYEAMVDSGENSLIATLLTETLRSTSPDHEETTLSDGKKINIDWLNTKLQREISITGAQVESLLQVCAWAVI